MIQPAEKAKQEQEQIAPLAHTDQGLRQILGGNTDYCKFDGDYAVRVHNRPRKALFTPHNSGCPIPEEELDDWRLTIINKSKNNYKRTQDNFPSKNCNEDQKATKLHWRNQIQKKDNHNGKWTHHQPDQLRAPQKKIWRPKAAPSTDLDTTQPKETIHRPLAAQEDNQDYWERQGEHWLRQHTTLRTTLFTPTDRPGHPPISTLEPHRLTITHNNFRSFTTQKMTGQSWATQH